MTTTFTNDVEDPGRILGDAKRLVAIATEAEDQALLKALAIIKKYIKKPGTCAHPGKVLSADTKKQNDLVAKIADEVTRMLLNEIPF